MGMLGASVSLCSGCELKNEPVDRSRFEADGAFDSGDATALDLGPIYSQDRGSARPRGTMASLELRDSQTGESYDLIGRSSSGDVAHLTPLPGYNQFCFAWSVFNHESEIWRKDHRVDTAPLTGDGECAVPCDEIVLGCPGRDCIPALSQPTMVSADSQDADYIDDNSFVVGVVKEGAARAYPHNILWWHEIVNDVVAGVPIAITHCPLTWSTLGHDPTQFNEGKTVELGVSGRLFNANLVFYNREDDSWFSQLLGAGTRGRALGQPAPRVHVWEMTWAAWKAMFPSTLVVSGETGHARSYTNYPYGEYFGDHDSTFMTTEPLPDPTYPNKTLTYGLRLGDEAKAYAYTELLDYARETRGEDGSPVGVINDTVAKHPVTIVFDLDAGYVQAFDRTGHGEFELEGVSSSESSSK